MEAAEPGPQTHCRITSVVQRIVCDHVQVCVSSSPYPCTSCCGCSERQKQSALVHEHILSLPLLDSQPWAQLCLAFRSAGGTVAVVLSSRSKLEMEELFRRTIPEESRFGTRFVFREVGTGKTNRRMCTGWLSDGTRCRS